MLISGGKVVAIDEVLHDQTLTGDGRFNKLGVNSGYFLTKAAADQYYQPKGDYAYRSDLGNFYTKTEANGRFALIANVYTRDVLDRKFQDIANTYATKTELNDVAVDLNNYKAEVARTYLTKNNAADTYATKTELANQYTTITSETDGKIDSVNDSLNELAANFGAHAEDTTIHFTEDEKNAFNTLTAYDFTKFVNTSGLDDLPKNKQYAIFNGEWGWQWVETQGGGGVGNLTAGNGILITPGAETTEIALDAETWLAVQEAAKLETAYQLVGDRGITVFDDDDNHVTKIQTQIPEVVFTDEASPTTAALTVYLQTMTADLL